MEGCGGAVKFSNFDKISATLMELTVARVCFCKMMAIKIRRSRNLKSNAISKQTSAKFVVENEGLLHIKNFQYSLFRMLNCF